MRRIGRVFDGILTVTLYVSSVFTALLVLSVCYDVTMRYLFNRPTAWSNDLSGYLVYGMTFIAAGCVLRERSHISVDIGLSLLPPGARAVTNSITSVLCVFFCGVFAWTASEATWVSFTHRYPLVGGIRIPEYTILWLVPFGMFLLFIQFIRQAGSDIAHLKGLWSRKGGKE